MKNKKNVVEETDETPESEPDMTKEKPSMTQVKALFETYAEALAQVEIAKGSLEEAMRDKSQSIEDIFETVGKGPFDYKGNKLTIMKRGETYFFKGEGTAPVMKIG